MNQFTLRYTLPAGYSVAELPPVMEEKQAWGRVRLTFHQDGDKLIAEGEVAMTSARIKADDYASFRDFLARVDQAFAARWCSGARPGEDGRALSSPARSSAGQERATSRTPGLRIPQRRTGIPGPRPGKPPEKTDFVT